MQKRSRIDGISQREISEGMAFDTFSPYSRFKTSST
jgi:hypothetical protein